MKKIILFKGLAILMILIGGVGVIWFGLSLKQ